MRATRGKFYDTGSGRLVRGRKEHSSTELLRRCIFLENTMSLLFVPLVDYEYYSNIYTYNNRVLGQV